MDGIEKALRAHTALVKAGVSPEYARIQLTHRAADLEGADVEVVTADLLANTPQKFMVAPKAEGDTTTEPPAYDPVAAGRALAAKQKSAADPRLAFS